jgi:hypothetical protein
VVVEVVCGDADDLDVALCKVGCATCDFAELGRADGCKVCQNNPLGRDRNRKGWTDLPGARRGHPKVRNVGQDLDTERTRKTYPRVTEPFVEVDRADGGLCVKVGGNAAETESIFVLGESGHGV